MIRLQLPFPPSVNSLFRDGGRGAGKRPRTVRYLTWIRAADNVALTQKQPRMSGPVRLKILLGKPDNRRRDCTNYIKAVEDWLVSREYIEGDDSRFVKGASVDWAEVDGALVEVTAA